MHREYKIIPVKKDLDFIAVKVNTSLVAKNFAMSFYHEDIEIYESVFMILLDASSMTIGYVKISQGGVKGSVVDIKLILFYAINSLATSFILIHNHPSGQLKPSQADLKITKSIKESCKIVDLQMLDHIIITKDSHYSFADEGDL